MWIANSAGCLFFVPCTDIKCEKSIDIFTMVEEDFEIYRCHISNDLCTLFRFQNLERRMSHLDGSRGTSIGSPMCLQFEEPSSSNEKKFFPKNDILLISKFHVSINFLKTQHHLFPHTSFKSHLPRHISV